MDQDIYIIICLLDLPRTMHLMQIVRNENKSLTVTDVAITWYIYLLADSFAMSISHHVRVIL